MKRLYAIAACVCILSIFSCSKGGSSTGQGGQGTGPSGGSASGPWLTNISEAVNPQSTLTSEIKLNNDHSVQCVITTSTVAGVTTYATLVPVYAGGKLTELLHAPDSLSTTGPVETAFDYTPGGTLLRIRYNPGTPQYAYDSLIFNSSNYLTAFYHFIPVGPSATLTEVEAAVLTWSNQHNITQTAVNAYDTSGGTWSSLQASYEFDGSFNPYLTVKDLPLILGQATTIAAISANNVTAERLSGYSFYDTLAYTYNTKSLPTSSDIQLVQSGITKTSTFTYFQYIE